MSRLKKYLLLFVGATLLGALYFLSPVALISFKKELYPNELKSRLSRGPKTDFSAHLGIIDTIDELPMQKPSPPKSFAFYSSEDQILPWIDFTHALLKKPASSPVALLEEEVFAKEASVEWEDEQEETSETLSFSTPPYYEEPLFDTFHSESPCFVYEELEEPCISKFLYVAIDYLYWKAWPETLLFAVDGFFLPPSNQGKGYFQPGRWDSGVRYLLGCLFEPETEDATSLSVEYTQFKTHAIKTVLASSSDTLLGVVDVDNNVTQINDFDCSEIDNSWRLSYEVVDITLKKWWGVRENWAWSSYTGLRGAWITNRYIIHATERDPLAIISTLKKLNSRNYGLQGGFCVQWQLAPPLTLCSTSGMGLLWASNHTHFICTDSFPLGFPSYDDVNDRFTTLQVVFDLKLGVEYMSRTPLWFSCNSYWGCSCSWEFHYWLDQNHRYICLGESPDQNIFEQGSALYLQGISVRFFLNW